MANRKTVEQQIAEVQEKIKQEQNALKKLQKKQTDQNNKARNHRLCRRHGFLECILPDTIELTDEQYQKFVKQHIANSHGVAVLEKIKAQGATDTLPKPTEQAEQSSNPAPQKSAQAEQNSKPNAPAGEKHNSNNPPKHNPQNAGTNSPSQGTPKVKPA